MNLRHILLAAFIISISISPAFASFLSQNSDAPINARSLALFLEAIPSDVAVKYILPALDYYDFCSISLTSKGSHNGMRVWWNTMKDLKEQCRKHGSLDQFRPGLSRSPTITIVNYEDEVVKLLCLANRYRLPLIGIRIQVASFEKSFFYEVKRTVLAAAGNERLGLKAPHIFYLSLPKDAITKVRHLDMSYCNLTDLPSCIGQLTSLVSLNLLGNTIRELPSSMRRLTKLRDLNLMMNPVGLVNYSHKLHPAIDQRRRSANGQNKKKSGAATMKTQRSESRIRPTSNLKITDNSAPKKLTKEDSSRKIKNNQTIGTGATPPIDVNANAYTNKKKEGNKPRTARHPRATDKRK